MDYKLTVPYSENDIRAMGKEIENAENAFEGIKAQIENELKDKLPGVDYATFLKMFDDLEKEIQNAETQVNKIKEINQGEIDRKGFPVTITVNTEDALKTIQDAYDKALETSRDNRFRNTNATGTA